MKADVFISHSTSDKDLAERMCRILEGHDIVCWMAPRDVPLGAFWAAAINHAIEDARAFVLILSPEANSSPYVVSEVNLAFAQRKTILVFRTDDILPTEDLQFFLACPQWADGFPPPLEARITQMAGALRLLLCKDQLKPVPEERGRPGGVLTPAAKPAALSRAPIVARTDRPETVPPVARVEGPEKVAPPVGVHRSSGPGGPQPVRPARQGGRVFDAGGRLQTSRFAFAIDGVLLRAAKRRNEQGRGQATVSDLLAGLLRRGGLTRFLAKRAGLDPDALYSRLLATPEDAPEARAVEPQDCAALNDGTVPDAARLQAMLARWILGRHDDFAAEVAALLDLAATRSEGPVTEHALLEALIDTPAWTEAGLGLPARDEARALLAACVHSEVVDANGAVPLGFLSDTAGQIVQRSLLLSQQCRTPTITHRLFMAALIEQDGGFAARVCRCAGVDTALLRGLLVTMSTGHEQDSDKEISNVILSSDVCRRIVTPVLVEARRRAADPEHVSEPELFRAFCQAADPAFAEFLKSRSTLAELEPIEADLAELASIDPDRPGPLDRLTLRARQVVRLACDLSRSRGTRVIPNRLLLAAFLAGDDAHAHCLLGGHKNAAHALHDLLVSSVERGSAPAFDLDEEACSRIVQPVIEWARHQAADGGFVNESLLFRAFCDVADADFKAALHQVGVDLDAFSTGWGSTHGPGPWGPH